MSYGLTDTIIRCNPAAGETEKFRELKDELIYIVHHSPEGAVGVNLNQLYQQKITDLVESIPPFAHITPEQLIIPNLLKGGPVHANTPWVLASGRYAHQHSFSNDHMTLSFSDDGFSAEYDAGIVCGVGSYGWGEKQPREWPPISATLKSLADCLKTWLSRCARKSDTEKPMAAQAVRLKRSWIRPKGQKAFRLRLTNR